MQDSHVDMELSGSSATAITAAAEPMRRLEAILAAQIEARAQRDPDFRRLIETERQDRILGKFVRALLVLKERVTTMGIAKFSLFSSGTKTSIALMSEILESVMSSMAAPAKLAAERAPSLGVLQVERSITRAPHGPTGAVAHRRVVALP
jgi:hypothetical protein